MKYNEIKTVKGIYSITNTKTGNTYVGMSKDIYARWGKHINDLKHNNHHQHKLQDEFNKYSIDDFDFKVLEVFNNYQEDIVKQLEDEYILEFRKKGLGFEQLTNKEIGGNYIASNLSKNKKENDKCKENFIMIPKGVILDREYSVSYSDKFICILTILFLFENKQSYVKFTIEDLIITSGSKPRGGKNGINNKVKSIIKLMIQNGILECDIDTNKITMNGLIKGKLHMPYEINSIGMAINWFKVDINKYSKILDNKTKKSKFTMTNLYFYILARIIRRNDNFSQANCGAEVFWCSQEEMCNTLNITRQTLNTYLKALSNLGLIYYDNIGKLVKDNTIITPHNVYATNVQELKEGLKQSKFYWENQGWELVNK